MSNSNELPQPWNLDPGKKTYPRSKKSQFSLFQLTLYDNTKQNIFRIHLDEFETENQFKKNKTLSFFHLNISNKADKKKFIHSELLRSTPHSNLALHIQDFPYFLIDQENLNLSKDGIKINFSQSKITIDLTLQIIQETEFNSFSKLIHYVCTNKTKQSIPPAYLIVSGKVTVNDQVFNLDKADGILDLSSGIQRETKQTKVIAHRFVNELNEPTPLFLFAEQIKSPTIIQNIHLNYSYFLIFYENKTYSLNSIHNIFHIKQKLSDQSWDFQIQKGKTLIKGFVRTQIADMFLHRLENTDSSLLFKAFSLNADVEINILENGRLKLRATSNQCNIFEFDSIQQTPYITDILE